MQTTTTAYNKLAQGYVRSLTYGVRVSFEKSFYSGVVFFELDTSALDGPDVLAPSDSNPVQEWDKYVYLNYDDRVISVEIVREENEPYSVMQAYADVTLNNYDDYFTPNSGSPIDSYILPRRPFRVLMGFGNEALPQIVGLSEGMPKIDKSSRTATFHVIDFMSFLLDKDVGESVTLQDVYTHEVLDYLLQYMGLLTSQYSLDTSFNRIPFFYIQKGTKFKTIIDKLMEAEIGRFFLDEQGIVRFRNRYNYDLTPVYIFNKSNTIDYSVSDESSVINTVKITSQVRQVQPSQSIWTSASVTRVLTGQTVEIWAEFSDPITSITDPSYSAEEASTSYFLSALNSDGTGDYAEVNLVSLDLFSKSAKMIFENVGSSNAYITAIDLYGTPAKVIETIKVQEKDQDSIDKFEVQLYEIDNAYIQDASNAQSRALMLINDFKNYGGGVNLEVKGNPALQLGDAITLDLDGYQGTHVITKTTNIISEGKFTQRIRARKKTPVIFFSLDSSILDGPDLLAP